MHTGSQMFNLDETSSAVALMGVRVVEIRFTLISIHGAMGYHGIQAFFKISVGISSVLATIQGQNLMEKLNITFYPDRVE